MSSDRTTTSFAALALCAVAVVALSGCQRPLAQPADPALQRPKEPAAKDSRPVDSPKKQFECRFTEQPIAIDGKRDDVAWSKAEEIGPFVRTWEKEARKPTTGAKAFLLWDREFLYFFAELEDTDVFADVREHDGETWSNDVFELFFKPADDKRGYYEFQVNALGTQMDMFLPRRGAGGYPRFKSDMQFHMESKVAVDGTLNRWQDEDKGWSVEGRIPWSDFVRTGGRPAIDETWKFALCRYDYSVDFEGPEISSIAPLTQPSFHRHEDYATLRFVGPDKTKPDAARHGIEKLLPLTTSRILGSPDPPLPYTTKKAYPKLKANFPVAAKLVPGTDWLLFIDETWPYSPTKLRRMRDNPDVAEFETLLDFGESVAYDICFHPNYRQNGYVYIGDNGLGSDGKKYSRVTRYFLEPRPPFKFDASSAQVVIEWQSGGHNGAAIEFGPDGMLYVTSGDGSSDSDTDNVGQRLDTLRSKVLRIDVDHVDEGRMYSVPRDNPFVGRKNARPETWAYGLRNPWRIAIDRHTGNIWVGNNGQDLWEQVYLIERGANYGWSVYEGSHPFYAHRKLGPTPLSPPIFEHSHSESRSLTGGVVYHGDKLPELKGAYLYGDHSTGKIWGALHDGKKLFWHKELADTPFNITGFALDGAGEVLVLDHRGEDQGNFYHLVPQAANEGGNNFPAKLSETGLFRSVAKHKVEPALIPFSVNSPQWASGAFQQRYLALVGDDAKINVTATGGWNFPDRTVLIKSIGMEFEEGNPDSRRWLETQLLTKQQGEWAGYTYAWNDENTDAVLVGREGLDKPIEVKAAAGVRKQVWRFASRGECMSCHSRAANFVLGMTTEQLNKDHDYGDVVDNQLRTLEHLGILRVDWKEETRHVLHGEFRAEGLTHKEAWKRVDEQMATRDQREPPTSALLSRPHEKLRSLPDPADTTASLDARVRSYLHANCAHCHVSAGGGNAQFDIAFTTGASNRKLINFDPVHSQFDIASAKLIAPGDPYRSVLYYRLCTSGSGRMPQIGSHEIDKPALRLVRDWIAAMPPEKNASQQQVALAKERDDELLASLENSANSQNAAAAIDSLLASTRGALALLDAVEDGRLKPDLSQTIIAKATSHERVPTRDLFERFLPHDQRTKRLGTSVDAQEILALQGDGERGRALFVAGTTANCKSCHRLGAEPEQLGPDVADIGKRLSREEILDGILDPSKKVDEKYRMYVLVTTEGKVYTGLLVRQDDGAVVLTDGENKQHTFAREEIDELTPSTKSMMPDSLVQNLTAQQLADLLALFKAAQ